MLYYTKILLYFNVHNQKINECVIFILLILLWAERCLPISLIFNPKTSEKYSIVFRIKKKKKKKQNTSCLLCLVCVSSLLPKCVALSRCFTKDLTLQIRSWANTKTGICRYFPEKVKGPIKVMTFGNLSQWRNVF